jgi:predicted transcriptional regulator
MMKYRRRLEIIADTLYAAEKGAKKTRIMYIANLSYKLLEKYLGETIEIGLMHFNNDGYAVTEKGYAFLEKYSQFSSKYAKLSKELEAMKFERAVLERMCEPTDDNKPKAMMRGHRK